MNIKILCRTNNSKAKRLESLLTKYGNTQIVAHNGIQSEEYRGLCRSCRGVTIPVKIGAGTNLNTIKKENPYLYLPEELPWNFVIKRSLTTSWDLAFKDIEIEDTLFIEDDVAANDSFFEPYFKFLNGEGKQYDLVSTDVEKREESNWWPNWKEHKKLTDHDMRSFNPFCFLKKNIIQGVLDFKEKHGCFMFHEILFPTLAKNPYDLKDNLHFNLFFFRWRVRGKIHTPFLHRSLIHAVKADSEHKKICDNTGEEVVVDLDLVD